MEPHEPECNDYDGNFLDLSSAKPMFPPLHRKLTERQSRDIKKNKAVRVFVKVVFLKIGEIDTIKEQYTADLFFQSRWREPVLDTKREKDFASIDFSQYWNPKINLHNLIDDSKVKHDTWYRLHKDQTGRAFIIEKQRIAGNFSEYLELKEFPFDTQNLSVSIVSQLSEIELEFVPDDQELSSVNSQSFIDEQEWALYDHVETWPLLTNREYANSRFKHPGLLAQCKATRRPGFFIWNVFLITLLISSLCLSSFAVALTDTHNRLQLAFTLLLTAVAFKFIVNQSLPKISYLTYLDVYILASMIFTYFIAIWHAIVSLLLHDLNHAKRCDLIAIIVLVVVYCLFQVAFGLYIFIVIYRTRRLLKQKDQDYAVMASKILGQQYFRNRGKSRRARRVQPNISAAMTALV